MKMNRRKKKKKKGRRVQSPSGVAAHRDFYLQRRDQSRRMTGIYSVPGAQLRSQQHKQTRPNICILIHFWEAVSLFLSSPILFLLLFCFFSFFLATIQPKHTWSKKKKKSSPAKHRSESKRRRERGSGKGTERCGCLSGGVLPGI